MDIVRIWETGVAQSPMEKAMTMLAAAFPEMTRDEMAGLTLGQVNTRLLAVRERLLGPDMNCYTECPACGERLAFTIAVSANSAADADRPKEQELSMDGYQVRFRLLNSLDLKVVAGDPNKQTARRLLIERCVLHALREEQEISASELPATVLAGLAARLSECDPQAEELLDLECPSCKGCWQAVLDVAGFFWQELSTQARRLLGEVHAVAGAYGWGEAEILSMSARRRHFYLEMIGA
jgi:hypothetical protein